jgi:fermentation-respiration switch protein FrsA (DUF1100 family)
MIFYPLSKIEQTPQDWDMQYEPVKITMPDGVTLSAWYLPHPQAKKTVLFFHGNGGNISYRGDSLYIFNKLGLNTLIIDYPGYGESEGTPSEKSLYQSADAAWHYLVDDKKLSSKDIIIFGRSLGGAVAADLASRVEASGLIMESTFSSTRDIVDMAFPLLTHLIYLRYSFNTISKIKNINVPILMIHSPEDDVIPFELGYKVFQKIKTRKYFVKISGNHNEGFMQSIALYMPALREFISII